MKFDTNCVISTPFSARQEVRQTGLHCTLISKICGLSNFRQNLRNVRTKGGILNIKVSKLFDRGFFHVNYGLGFPGAFIRPIELKHLYGPLKRFRLLPDIRSTNFVEQKLNPFGQVFVTTESLTNGCRIKF